MNFFGLQITRSKAKGGLSSVPQRGGGWYPLVRESFAGAWQRNILADRQSVLANHAHFSCTTLIASDIAKLRVKLTEIDNNGIWNEVSNAAFSPVLKKPNKFQNRIQFWESWILSKLNHGNTYILKVRDNRNVVVGLYVLDPLRTLPLVATDGSVFYQLQTDKLAGIDESVIVPAREMIHDRWNCLFHPLVGISPIFANALSATQGLNIQKQSIRLFANNSNPGGILTAPEHIEDDTAKRIKEQWEQNYTGENVGRVAVLGDGLKYESNVQTAVEGQLIDQLKLSAEIICSTYHVPPYKAGLAAPPAYNNIQALNVEYYTQCLQRLIEDAELCLDEGLGLDDDMGTEFDLDGLFRMDSLTQVQSLKEAVSGTLMAPNEARKKMNLKPVAGGDAPLSQQQNFSLAALAKRDASDNPFGVAPKPDQVVIPPPPPAAGGKGSKAIQITKQQTLWAGSPILDEAA